MASQTVAAHLDARTVERLATVVRTENRNASQVLGVPLKAFLDFSPNARRALFAIDGTAGDEERAFAARVVGRALLRAYEAILDARRDREKAFVTSNLELETDEDIEAEAVRLCRM